MLAGIAACGVGCGSQLEYGQVEGLVRVGGKPVPNAVVTFVPDQAGDVILPQSAAQTDEQGRYRLQLVTQEPGAVVGKHRVTVEDLAMQAAPRSADGTVLKRPPVRFSPSYADPLRTPLTHEVHSGTQTINLDLLP